MITKRKVGIVLVLLGMVIVGATIAVDVFGAGKWEGLGPAQRLAVVVGISVSLMGLTLIPLGNRPA